MSKYYYNGVLLPKIPTHKDYPYTIIYECVGLESEGYPSGYYVSCSDFPFAYQNNSFLGELLAPNIGDGTVSYDGIIYYVEKTGESYSVYDTSWIEEGWELFIPLVNGITFIWTNHDIDILEESENTPVIGTYVEASDPIAENANFEVSAETMVDLANIARKLDGNTEVKVPFNISEMLSLFGRTSLPTGDVTYANYVMRTLKTLNSNYGQIPSHAFRGFRKLSEVNLPNCSTISNFAFGNCDSLKTFNAPNCSVLSNYVFDGCHSLEDITLGDVKDLPAYAFYECSSLKSMGFSNCSHIGTLCFAYCSSLTDVSFPNCTHIDTIAFQYCTSLTHIDLPMVSSLDYSVFSNCTNLQSVNLPICESLPENLFYSCFNLQSVNVPNCKRTNRSCFAYNSALQSINLPKCTYIDNYTFMYCSSLSTVILGGSSFCSLGTSNAFYRAGITSSTGIVYVPSSLMTTYQANSYWKYFSTRFSAIENMA